MKDEARDPLEEIHRELARQDAIWSGAKEQLRALGDVRLGIPDEVLEGIDRAFTRAERREPDAVVAWAVRG